MVFHGCGIGAIRPWGKGKNSVPPSPPAVIDTHSARAGIRKSTSTVTATGEQAPSRAATQHRRLRTENMTRYFWQGNFLAASILMLLAAASGFAGDDAKGKGKGPKEEKRASGKVQIDLSTLPPDLAKQLQKYVG